MMMLLLLLLCRVTMLHAQYVLYWFHRWCLVEPAIRCLFFFLVSPCLLFPKLLNPREKKSKCVYTTITTSYVRYTLLSSDVHYFLVSSTPLYRKKNEQVGVLLLMMYYQRQEQLSTKAQPRSRSQHGWHPAHHHHHEEDIDIDISTWESDDVVGSQP